MATALNVSRGATVNMGGNRVMNVAAPVAGTDAANKSYVDANVGVVASDVVTLSNRVDRELATVNTRLADLGRRSDQAFSGVAMAFAMAGVPTVLPHERVAFALNYGTFQGQSGLGLNAAVRLDNYVQLNAGIGYGTNENLLGARAGLRVGW